MPMVEDDCEEDRARLTGLGDAVAGKSKARLVEMQKPCPHLKRNGPKTAADSSCRGRGVRTEGHHRQVTVVCRVAASTWQVILTPYVTRQRGLDAQNCDTR